MIAMVSSETREPSIKFSLLLYLSVLSLVRHKLKTNFILNETKDSWKNADFRGTFKPCWPRQPNIHTNKYGAIQSLLNINDTDPGSERLRLPGAKGKSLRIQGKTNLYFKNKHWSGTSLAVQWLRRHTPDAGGMGSIPGQGTKNPICCTVQQNNDNNKLWGLIIEVQKQLTK